MLFIIVVAVCLASATADSSESSEEQNFFGTPIHFGHSAVFGNENEEQNSGIVGTPLSLEKEEVFGGGISGEGIVGTPSHLEEEAVFGGPGEMEEENPVFVGTPLHLEEEAVFGGPGEMEEENPVIVGTPLHLEEEAVFGGPSEMEEENPVIVGTPLHLEEENAFRGPGEIPEEPEETSNEQYTIGTLLELKKVYQLSDVNDNEVLEEHEVNSIVRRGDINNDGQLSEQELLLDPATKLSPSTFPIFDFNSDGRITLEDVRVAFSKLKQLSDGDAITFKNFVELFGHKLPAGEDSKMNIQTFLILEQNFEISDLDDDRVISQEEYTSVFRLADENRNGLIDTDELFIPTRHIDTTHFCVTACTEQKLNNLFSILDTNMDGKLTFPEYVNIINKLKQLIVSALFNKAT